MRKYNKQLFFLGFLQNVARKFLLILAAIVLAVAGIRVRGCLYGALGILALVLVWSFVQQLRIKYTVEHSDNPDFAPFAQAMTSENWKDAFAQAVGDPKNEAK